MEDMKEDKMEINAKDMKKVQQLHDELMSLADKYEMPMGELLHKCCGDMEEEGEYSDEEGDDMEEEKPSMDRAKIALIIGKMKPKGE